MKLIMFMYYSIQSSQIAHKYSLIHLIRMAANTAKIHLWICIII